MSGKFDKWLEKWVATEDLKEKTGTAIQDRRKVWKSGSTLYLLVLTPFKLQHSQLVSLWKSSHSGYKKWYCHFYTCQINKGDIYGFNLRIMKIRQVALSYWKIKNKYWNADFSTIDASLGVPGVSKDAPVSTKHGIWGLVHYNIQKFLKNRVFFDIFF